MKKIWFFVLFYGLAIGSKSFANIDTSPRANISFNLGELVGFTIASLAFFGDISCVDGPTGPYPFHVDGSFKINNKWALDTGLVYRFENYSCPRDKGNYAYLWTNYSEFFLLAGARYSLTGNGLNGLYTSAKVGPGLGFSKGGYAFTLGIQPEFGYSWSFTRTKRLGLNLKLGIGLLVNIPLIEDPHQGWDGLTYFPGYVVHRLIPVLNLGLGLAF